jgi:Dyp-type peroxidase family
MPDQPLHERLADARLNIQANLARAAKYSDRRPRNWSMFFFFRIMTKTEVEGTLNRSKSVLDHPDQVGLMESLLLDFEQPSFLNTVPTGRRRRGLQDPPTQPEPQQSTLPHGQDQQATTPVAQAQPPQNPRPEPAPQFFNWLKVLVSADKTAMVAHVEEVARTLAAVGEPSADGAEAFHKMLQSLRDPQKTLRLKMGDALPVEAIQRSLLLYARVLSDPALYREVLGLFGATADEAGAAALEDSLLGVTIYELLRQGAPAFAVDEANGSSAASRASRSAVRGEAHSRIDDAGPYDPVPINLAFTRPGLDALELDQATVASFPEPFYQGMAARAARLNDTGASAPANWEGEYGLPSIHGFFTGGFPAGSEGRRIKECVWGRLRDDIAAFNHRRSSKGRFLRMAMGLLFRQFGLEIVRIELAQDPYAIEGEDAVPLPERLEHFGFRDGISQPFADLGLADSPAGGGKPDIDGSWSPVAPGEIYLDLPDEDGEVQELPLSADLRQGGTYIVFRKLEQDVSGFRAFIEQQRPGGLDGQTKLAAQFVGRWPNGTPLSLSPDTARGPEFNHGRKLNGFRYAADDPFGLKCPLGAHIRRTNPRDTGGRGEVKRHRILRRGMAYGGSLLPPHSLSDGQPRGLFFIAVNSRIDLQFEVIQADWISNGEFLGQAGLGRCPLVASHDGAVEDSFLEAGATAPVTGLPRFVTTRGGDYFFAPGIKALRLLADGCTFAVPDDQVPYSGCAMGDAVTQGLFYPGRLVQYAWDILAAQTAGASAVRVRLPAEQAGGRSESMVFVGQHADVVRVLSDKAVGARLEFSVERYRQTAARITRGYDFIVGTEDVGPTAATRTLMYDMLRDAWKALKPPQGGYIAAITQITQQRLEVALRRAASVGRIDLVHDLAAQAAYGVVTELYGAPGPTWLTELAAALPFGSQHIASLPPDWLAAVKGGQPVDPGLTSMQIWSVLILADVLGNLQSDHEAWPFSHQAGSEMLSHIDGLLAAAMTRARNGGPTATLVDAFASIAPLYVQGRSKAARCESEQRFLRLAAVILMELIGDTIAAIPATFGHVLDFLLENRIDLASLRPILTQPPAAGQPGGFERLILEAERLNPILPVLLRRCETGTVLPSGAKIQRGDTVAALVQAADVDGRTFSEPMSFSLAPYLPGPVRNPDDYLAFGASSGAHACWGRRPVAMPVLVQCVEAAARLEDLRRVAGAAGETQSLVGVTIGLSARFTRAVK